MEQRLSVGGRRRKRNGQAQHKTASGHHGKVRKSDLVSAAND
jgi:hypothetical protein